MTIIEASEMRGPRSTGHLVSRAVRIILGVAMSAASVATVVAQEAPSQNAEEDVSTVVVTGSRIARDGMSAPTPVSVVGADRLEQRAATNIGDMLNEVPSFRATQSPATGSSGGYVGGRILDLRGLGSVRTLVLVDGKRFVPSTTVGTVDTNMVPSILLERAEVVTGGASAAYGSDAVAGVVNLILNDDLQGMKASADYSQSTYGDNDTYTAKLAGGTALFGGRGNFVAALEYEKSDGVPPCTSRDWCAEQWTNIGRPNLQSGLPANNMLPNAREAGTSPTGLITGPAALRGITFNPDGTPRKFVYGYPASAIWMSGGEGDNENSFFSGSPLVSPTTRYTAYAIGKFDFSDSVTGRLDLSFGHLDGRSATRELLAPSGWRISRDNPFIPTSSDPSVDVRGILNRNPSIQSFQLGRSFSEYGYAQTESENEVFRGVAALNGTLKGSWTWDSYYQFGRNEFWSTTDTLGINERMTRALDARRNGAGQIVCAVNADSNPNNDDPACIPINPFGNQLDSRVKDYVLGESLQTNVTTEHVLAGNVQGEVFDTWAGPVSLAGGLEFRRDEMDGDADPISQRLGFSTNNASVIEGKVQVEEAYLETIIPLATDVRFAETLEVNGAIRRTHYDREGAGLSSEVWATTWKAGAVWQPFEALRLRSTRSRDIRAPNISELFGPVTRGFAILADPGNGGAQANPVSISGSNPDLLPEEADTMTLGFVLQPTSDGFLGRMQLSVDYYDIEITKSIGVLGGQTIANRCYLGATEFCSLLTRDSSGALIEVRDVRQNVDELVTRGYDVEFGYRQPIGSYGDLDFRLLATYVADLITKDSAGSVDRAGQTGLRAGTTPGIAEYTLDGLLNWSRGPVQLSFHTRYIPSGRYSAELIGPDEPGYDIALPNSTNTNHVKNAWYFDLVGNYDMSRANDGSLVVYGGVKNIGNQDPARVPGANGTGNNVLFDPVGRSFSLGVRVSF